MFSCNCLNIIIEIEQDETLVKSSLDLLDDERNDPFFNQERWYVGNLCNINKVYPGLIRARRLGLWTINRCVNCNLETHAIHKEKGATFAVLNSKLLNKEDINKMRASDMPSSIFHIVVNPNSVEPETSILDTYQNRQALKVIKDLNDVISNYIRQEQQAVQERIKKFTEEQYELLNVCQDKAYKEREALVRIIQNAAKEEEAELSPKSPKTFGNVSDKHSASNSPSYAPFSPKRPKGPKSPKRQVATVANFSDDLLFDFETEEVSDSDSNARNSDDSDGELEEGEDIANSGMGIIIQKRKSAGSLNSVAKSCPVDIPIFSIPLRSKNSQSEAPEKGIDFSPRQNEEFDMAASIKALARSVHGDAIFGELPPRPRFTTQI